MGRIHEILNFSNAPQELKESHTTPIFQPTLTHHPIAQFPALPFGSNQGSYKFHYGYFSVQLQGISLYNILNLTQICYCL